MTLSRASPRWVENGAKGGFLAMRRANSALIGFVLLIMSSSVGWGAPVRLRLADCERIAMESNLAIAAARHGLDAAHSGVEAAKTGHFPKVDLETSYTRLGPTVTFTVP